MIAQLNIFDLRKYMNILIKWYKHKGESLNWHGLGQSEAVLLRNVYKDEEPIKIKKEGVYYQWTLVNRR